MSLVTMPASPVPAKIAWKPKRPTQVNRSMVTSKRRVTILAAAPRMYATVTMPPIVGEANVLAWRAFVVDLEGQAHSFRLVACERDQITGVSPLVKGAGQTGNTLITDGWGTAGLKLKRGQFVTVNDQLLMLMADAVALGGEVVLQFKPHLRVSPADNAPLTVTRPYALMSMSNDDTGWLADIGQHYGIEFECEESF